MNDGKIVIGERFFGKELQTLRVPIFYKSKLGRVLANRLFGLRVWFAKKISFWEALRNCLPSRFHLRSGDEKILESMEANADEVFKKTGLYEVSSITLFGNKFFKAGEKTNFGSWFHTFIMIFQSVVADQYHAKEFIKKDSIVIDAGANIGAFSAHAANIATAGQVYAFEPTPKTFGILSENISAYANVKAFNFGLGAKSGEGELVIAESSGSNTMADSGMPDSASASRVSVRITTIDNFVSEHGIQRVDFIKMDTEGYEGKILEGAKETIRRFSPVLSMSAYHHEDDKKTIPELIRSLNPKYKCRLTKSVEDNLLLRVAE